MKASDFAQLHLLVHLVSQHVVPQSHQFLGLCIWLSNNSPRGEIKFELQGGILLLNFPLASTLSGTTTTCRDTVPSLFGSSKSRTYTTCGTAIPSPFERSPCDTTTFAAPFGRAPERINTACGCGATYQSQFGSTPCQTSTSCGMRFPTEATITMIVGSPPSTTCTTSPSNFHNPQVDKHSFLCLCNSHTFLKIRKDSLH